MKKIKTWWKARTKMEKAEVVIALIATIGFTMQVPTVWASLLLVSIFVTEIVRNEL